MRIYWAARDINGNNIGNHHFILIEFEEDEEKFSRYNIKYAKDRRFLTIAAFADKNENIVVALNDHNDVKSVLEDFDPDTYADPDAWFDFSLALNELNMLPPNDMTMREFAELLLRLTENFHRNSQTNPVKYTLTNENCATYVNSLFKAAGVSEKDRTRLGEFLGIDWGEEDLLPMELFEPVK